MDTKNVGKFPFTCSKARPKAHHEVKRNAHVFTAGVSTFTSPVVVEKIGRIFEREILSETLYFYVSIFQRTIAPFLKFYCLFCGYRDVQNYFADHYHNFSLLNFGRKDRHY